MKNNTKQIGQLTEALAEQYLIKQGLHCINKNFSNRQGEIDLIMRDQQTLVFVEVKYRQNNHFGGAISAISRQKQQKIKQCAIFYLQHVGLNEYNTPCRFDVITLQGNIENTQITWLKNAF